MDEVSNVTALRLIIVLHDRVCYTWHTFYLSPVGSRVLYVSLKPSGSQTLILNRLQAIVSLRGCQPFSVWIIKVNLLTAACLTVWPHWWCFQQPWQHQTLQRTEPPRHPQVNVTWTWMCEQWHQWSHWGAQKLGTVDTVLDIVRRERRLGWRDNGVLKMCSICFGGGESNWKAQLWLA